MSDYSNFAFVYDALMGDVDYSARTEYLLELFKEFGDRPTLLLDVACGTGGFSNEFALRGIEVIGTDLSEEMLLIARENSEEQGTNVLYLCQSAQELDLYGTVDGAICCMDSINHITDIGELKAAFQKISLFLEPQKLFIFDVNTPYKHQYVLGDNTFVLEQEDIYCVWQNEYYPETCETAITLDFFTFEEGVYTRSGEDFRERAYTVDRLKDLLAQSGFKVEAVLGDMSHKAPKDTEERIFFVCRKV